ncbi:MAG: hypothetical protein AAF438_12845 [Pseudomonadota bacterium]
MNLQQAANLGEIVAAIAVIITLIYLVVETRRNTRQLRQQTIENLNAKRFDFLQVLIDDSEVSKIVVTALSGQYTLPARDYFRFGMYLYSLFVSLELAHEKRQLGHLSDQQWAAWCEAVDWWLRTPGVRTWWEGKPEGFTKAFRNHIDSQMRGPDPSPERTDRRLAFLVEAGRPT